MKRMSRCSLFTVAFSATVAAFCWSSPSHAGVSLTNPAAEYCIAEGGFFGVRNENGGQRGVCILDDGEEVDAWSHFRAHLNSEAPLSKTKTANPAATYCMAIGGSYNLETSTCLLADGSEVDAWALLREAHAAAPSLANPAATYCIEIGGAYEIRDGDDGQTGICKLPNGTEIDAWVLFRENN